MTKGTSMKNLLTLGAALLVGLALLLSVSSASASNGGVRLTTTLLGMNEVPGPGDPDGTGTAVLRLNPGQEEICYTLEVGGIAPARAAHIHVAPAGEAGPVVVGLMPPTDGTSSACAAADRTLIRAIIKNPAAYYVNVHNADFPAGAVRGQLSR